jgi:hypothetical protein
MLPKEMIQARLNGNISEHKLNWEIMTIDLNGVIQLIKRRKQMRKKKLMPKTTWELLNLINAENVDQCERLELIIVVAAKDAFIAWIIIVLGLIIVLGT